MKIRNLFIAIIITLFIGNTVFAQSAGIPLSEYNLLKEFYGNTGGSWWANNTNWLDTTNHSVADWYGITVENNHVTKIELSNNNLQEAIFGTRFLLPELKILDLSGNLIDDANFGNLDSLSNLEVLKIENNKFIFKHIKDISFLPYYNNFSGNFTYSPQAKIDVAEEISVKKGDIIEMSVSPRYLSANDIFQWYKDDIALIGETSPSFDKTNAVTEDAGTYYLKITNSDISGLTLQSFDKVVTVTDFVAGVPRKEYEALVEIYNSLDGDNWKNNDYWLDTINHHINDWYGVKVEGGHVTTLLLSNNNLVGAIPNIIGNLSGLQSLYLWYNNINGNIPAEIGNLTNLTSLDLNNNNNISGSIPKELGNLSKLEYLDLSGNNLSGSVPKELGNLDKLQVLYLSFNRISGLLPREIGNLSELRYFKINHNTIQGPLPAELSQLNKLETLHINANWIGKIVDENIPREARQIPNILGEMDSLKNLRIGQNYLLFNDIEPIFSWWNYNNLNEFKYENQISLHKSIDVMADPGETVKITIPNYYPSASDTYQWMKDGDPIAGANDSTLVLTNVQLENEGFYFCKISNNVVTDLTLQVYSTTLKVNDTHGAGVPLAEYNALVEFYNTTNGENWRKKTNWLDTINCTVAEWEGIGVINEHVYEIIMDTNNVSGSFPISFYDLHYLERIYFYMNELSGNLPDDIDKLTKLRTLYLSDNNLSGNIPESIGKLTNLNHLNLDNNNFEGNIPGSLGNLINLFQLSIQNNSLTGVIPSNLGNLTNLIVLNLSDNHLIGPVPAELKNLTKVYRIELENNLIGGSDSGVKSANVLNSKAENNRQIPDELADLISMDTFRLGNNNLQFNDIEAIFSWDNFSDFKDFIYHPQGLIGTEEFIVKTENESVTLSVKNYYPGNSDSYKWYKNGILIANSNSKTLTLPNLKPSHSGKYHCVITNSVATELSLTSREITLTVNEAINNNIPVSEFNALKTFYNELGGNYWMNKTNWLDTINATVSDWYGVTVNDGHITGIELFNNRLSGELPNALTELDSLTVLNLNNNYIKGMLNNWIGELSSLKKLNLSGNELHGLINSQLSNIEGLESLKLSKNNFSGEVPNLENIASLDEFSLANNNFIFNDLIPIANWANYNNFENSFDYLPQAKVGKTESLTFYVGDTINLEVKNYISNNSDNFEWFRNGISIQNGEKHYLEKEAWFDDNNCIFICEITNSLLPDLTLISDSIIVTVNYSSNDSLALINLRNEYEILQEIWTNDSVFTWSNITIENGFVTAIDFSGLNLEGNISPIFAQFDSLAWLNLSNNNLSGEIPPFSNTKNGNIKSNSSNEILTYFNIANNSFRFIDLETNASDFSNINVFIYAPQQSIGQPLDTSIYKYDTIIFEIENYIPGSFDSNKWFKDGQEVTGNNDLTFTIENAALQDSGYYTCSITNTLFTELTLHSDTSWLKVMVPVGINNQYLSEFNVYPNPAQNRVFIDTKNETIDLKVFNLTGNLVLEKNNTQSGWIDINQFTRGVYIFRAIRKNYEIINRKVIFK